VKCSRVRDHLEALLEASQDAAELAGVRQHLAGCESCRRELDLLMGLDALLSAEGILDPPAHLRPAVVARAAAYAQRVRQLPHWLEVSTLAGVCLALMAPGVLVNLLLGESPLHQVLSSPASLSLLLIGGAWFASVYYAPHA